MQEAAIPPIISTDAAGLGQDADIMALLESQRNLVAQANEYMKVYHFWQQYNEVFQAINSLSQNKVVISNTSNS